MSAEWLFPDQRPFWAQTESKEETMTTAKTAAKTTATKKETTMTKTETKKTRLPREEWRAQYIAGLKATIDELSPKHKGEDLPTPVNLYHILNAERDGGEVKALYASELEARVIALTCAENGWDAEYMTANQAAEYGGTPKADATGIKLHGSRVARGYVFYNVAEIEWAEGEPVWNGDLAAEHAATYAQRNAEQKANSALRNANKLARQAGMKTAKRGGNKKRGTTKATTKGTKKQAFDGLIPVVMPNGATAYLTVEQFMAMS